ncbi:hypothetical protein HDV57DRAFT_157394 [Trichoderma longibrachiatum]
MGAPLPMLRHAIPAFLRKEAKYSYHEVEPENGFCTYTCRLAKHNTRKLAGCTLSMLEELLIASSPCQQQNTSTHHHHHHQSFPISRQTPNGLVPKETKTRGKRRHPDRPDMRMEPKGMASRAVVVLAPVAIHSQSHPAMKHSEVMKPRKSKRIPCHIRAAYAQALLHFRSNPKLPPSFGRTRSML